MELTLSELTKKLIERDIALKESETMFRLAFCMNPTPMSITKLTGEVVKINHAFEEISGYSEYELLGKKLVDVGMYVNDDDRQKIVNEIKKNGIASKIKITYQVKTRLVHTEVTTKIITIKGTDCYLSIIEDITNRRYYGRKDDKSIE